VPVLEVVAIPLRLAAASLDDDPEAFFAGVKLDDDFALGDESLDEDNMLVAGFFTPKREVVVVFDGGAIFAVLDVGAFSPLGDFAIGDDNPLLVPILLALVFGFGNPPDVPPIRDGEAIFEVDANFDPPGGGGGGAPPGPGAGLIIVGFTKIPWEVGQVKYLTPATVPSFFPPG